MGANRTFNPSDLSLLKKERIIRAFITVPTGTTPVLQKWNYGAFNTGTAANTLSAAATTGGSTTPYNKYAQGDAGVFSVARTATGLWTLTLQDNYRRLLHVSGDMSIAGGTANIIAVVENPTITNISAANQGIVGIALLSATGTLADPTAAATTLIRIKIELADATEG